MTDLHDAASITLQAVAAKAGPGMDAQSLDVCRDFARLQSLAASIFGQRQRAYGVGNVQAIGGEGVMLRMLEKQRRVKHLKATGGDGGDDSIRDSLLDIANLALIALMVHEGMWPEAEWVASG